MNLTAPTKLQGPLPPLVPRLTGAWAIQASHQFLAEKVREARSPKLPSPPIRFIGFIQAAKASFPRFGSKINDIIGVSADILKTIDWFSIFRGCNRVLFFHSVYLVSHSRPFEKQNTGRSQDVGQVIQAIGNFIQGGRISV